MNFIRKFILKHLGTEGDVDHLLEELANHNHISIEKIRHILLSNIKKSTMVVSTTIFNRMRNNEEIRKHMLIRETNGNPKGQTGYIFNRLIKVDDDISGWYVY